MTPFGSASQPAIVTSRSLILMIASTLLLMRADAYSPTEKAASIRSVLLKILYRPNRSVVKDALGAPGGGVISLVSQRL